MSVFERIDWFSASLPKMCIYCAYGYPVVFGVYDWLDVFACGAHLVENLKSKKETLHAPGSGYVDSGVEGPARNVYLPMVGPRDRCDWFKPIRLDGRGVGFVNARKFYLLDKAGVFDDQRDDKQRKLAMDGKEMGE